MSWLHKTWLVLVSFTLFLNYYLIVQSVTAHSIPNSGNKEADGEINNTQFRNCNNENEVDQPDSPAHETSNNIPPEAGLSCKENKTENGLESAISSGMALGIRECQHQFRWSRWNCSHPQYTDNSGTREAAYVSAVTSAAVTYSIAKACARGDIATCGCAPPTTIASAAASVNEDHGEDPAESWDSSSVRSVSGGYWRWGGCSADVDFAVKLARRSGIANALRKHDASLDLDPDSLAAMNVHNNKAGRKLVQLTLDTDCKCHGVSGSCTLKTCWLKLPQFRKIGERLLSKYKRSRLVELQKSHGIHSSFPLSFRHKYAKSGSKLHKKPNLLLVEGGKPLRTELVHLRPSLTYCDPDPDPLKLGLHPGTRGRRCLRGKQEEGSCDILCCGRGYNTHVVWRRWKCHCKFRWCCVVECQDCQQRVQIYTCN